MEKLTLRQTEDGGNVSYRIDAVSGNGTEVKAYILKENGELDAELPLERVSAAEIEVPDGLYVRADLGWHAKSSIDGSKLPEGRSTIVLVLQRDGREIDRMPCGDTMTGSRSSGGQEGEDNLNDQLGYVCYIDNLSGMTFNTKKGKVFVTGYVYSDAGLPLSKISYSIDDGAVSGNGNLNSFVRGFDRSDAAARRSDLEDSGFTIGSKNQGCFAIPLNMKKLPAGSHEVTVTFLFAGGEAASYSTRFNTADDGETGEIVKDGKAMLNLMGYQ